MIELTGKCRYCDTAILPEHLDCAICWEVRSRLDRFVKSERNRKHLLEVLAVNQQDLLKNVLELLKIVDFGDGQVIAIDGDTFRFDKSGKLKKFEYA